MKSISMNTALRIVAAAFLALGGTALAQEGPAGSMAEFWTVHVSGDSTAAFEQAIQAHMQLRKDHEDPFHWETFTPITGDDMFVYSFRSCCHAWAEFDAYEAWAGEHAEVEANWNETVHPHVSSYEHGFSEIDMAHSNWPSDEEGPIKFVGVTSFKLKPGGRQQFQATLAELSQIALNNGWADEHNWAWAMIVNGKPTVNLVFPFKDYADMAPPEQSFFEFLSERLGSDEAAAAKLAGFSESTYGSTYQIYRHRPELSTPH